MKDPINSTYILEKINFKTELELIPNNPSKISFSGQQRALIQSLIQKSPMLETIYRGGIWVLHDTSNPDRFSLCAHAIRELMEKFPTFLDVSTQAQTETLKSRINDIQESFLSMKQNSICFDSTESWNGNIDKYLRKFLLKFEDFLSWFTSHHPRRREEFNNVLTRLEGSGRALPTPLAELNVDVWEEMRNYFQAIAHHRTTTITEAEFMQWLDALERFLLDRLIPRTFDDFAEIDTILEEEDN